jgi:hypothetical protein
MYRTPGAAEWMIQGMIRGLLRCAGGTTDPCHLKGFGVTKAIIRVLLAEYSRPMHFKGSQYLSTVLLKYPGHHGFLEQAMADPSVSHSRFGCRSGHTTCTVHVGLSCFRAHHMICTGWPSCSCTSICKHKHKPLICKQKHQPLHELAAGGDQRS